MKKSCMLLAMVIYLIAAISAGCLPAGDCPETGPAPARGVLGEAGRLAAAAGNRPGWSGQTDWDRQTAELSSSGNFTTASKRPESGPAKKLCFDLDEDGNEENYALEGGKLTVFAGSRIIWQSPEEWRVDDFVIGDANNDGIPDLNLIVWKAGSFGPHKPFWVAEEDKRIRNHLFIFDLVNGAIKTVWQSSNLDRPNYAITLEDLDGDGQNELIATEGDYNDPEKRQISCWKWNGWGFFLISGEPGEWGWPASQ